MERTSALKEYEEGLEDKIDRINYALQNTMKELDVSANHTRGYSIISCLHSYTNSYCNFDAIDLDCDKSEENFHQPIEELLLALDRAQMTVEDFLADSSRKPKKQLADDTANYIMSLELENKKVKKNSKFRSNSIEKLKTRARTQKL